MNRRLALCVLLLAIAGNVPILDASCAPPRIALDIKSGTTGAKVRINGAGFMSHCADTNLVPPATPAKRIKLSFVQGKTEILLAVVDATGTFDFSAPVMVPAAAAAGTAIFVADTGGWRKRAKSPEFAVIP